MNVSALELEVLLLYRDRMLSLLEICKKTIIVGDREKRIVEKQVSPKVRYYNKNGWIFHMARFYFLNLEIIFYFMFCII
jgi:hypothetical protein